MNNNYYAILDSSTTDTYQTEEAPTIHKTADHKKGIGKNAKSDKDKDNGQQAQQAQQANTASIHSGFGADFMSG